MALLSIDEFGRDFPQARRIDASTTLNIAPGELARGEFQVLREALVPGPARVGRGQQLFDNRPTRRLECSQGRFNGRLYCQSLVERDCVLHGEPRARADGKMRRTQRVADEHCVPDGPALVAQVGKVPPYGPVRNETVPSQCGFEYPFTVLKRLSFVHGS